MTHVYPTFLANEPLYKFTGREIQPKQVGEDSGEVIFKYYPISSVNYVSLNFFYDNTSSFFSIKVQFFSLLQFCRSAVAGSACSQVHSSQDPSDLIFESRFESGNLAKVVKITSTYYELSLRSDMYTNRHTQWFYFRIENTKKNIKYRYEQYICINYI